MENIRPNDDGKAYKKGTIYPDFYKNNHGRRWI